jgi:hypothetical protein
MPIENGVFTLRGRAAWAHDFDGYNVANAPFITLPGAAFVGPTLEDRCHGPASN